MAVMEQRRTAMRDYSAIEILFHILNFIFVFLGLGLITVGIYMIADGYVRSYYTIVKRSQSDNIMFSACGLFIFTGMGMVGVGVLAFFGMFMKNSKFLMGYVLALVIFIIIHLIVGFIAISYREQFHLYSKDGMLYQLQEYYTVNNTVGKAWNWVQAKMRCCGVDGPWDYQDSNWWHSQNPNVENPDSCDTCRGWVPNSCCVLEWDQDRDLWRTDPQQARPVNPDLCQRDAQGRRSGSSYLNGQGCFAATLIYIWRWSTVVIGLALGIAVLEIIILVLTFFVLRLMSAEEKR